MKDDADDFDEEKFFRELGLARGPLAGRAVPAFPPEDEAEATSAPPKAQPEEVVFVPADDTKPDHLGHRERVRKRFATVGGEAFQDYELLELLLFNALPRRDTKAIAKRLLREFKTFAEVLGAPYHQLAEVEGVGPGAAIHLKAMAAGAQRLVRGAVAKRDVLTSYNLLLDYCRTTMAFQEREQFRVLYLNKRNALIADELQQEGTIDFTPAYPREVINRAYNLGATAVILVHNHPSGDPEPSRADIELTRTMIAAGKALNVTVHDHIIVGRDGHASLKGLGYI
ncbi:RadC family protein [Tianweitania sediminis]|uniref:DNA repair protein RadC n=1 Tax=Tianweitania sediminis TaxID=1502156 RepID=A0A8J7RJX5_9HYPH|nr:DNA repair protein RadC [Tianweitania sediminis]MBP0439826.1 DNA repair protein RadC [Tianweitania sediminis]